MKKTNLLLVSIATILSLAACGGAKKDDKKIVGIEGFCDSMKDATNYTVEFDEGIGELVKVKENAVDFTYLSDEGEELREGYFYAKDKGVYTYSVEDKQYLIGDVYSCNDKLPLSCIAPSPAFFSTAGDSVWKDTDDLNVFTSNSGKLKTLACSFLQWDEYEDYASEVTLEFDNYADIKSAKISLTIDLSEYYGEGYVFDCWAKISDIGTTEIAGVNDFIKNASIPSGIGSSWTDDEKAAMQVACGEVLPTVEWSYASYTSFNEMSGEFDIFDYAGGDKGAEFERKLVAAGWEYVEEDSAGGNGFTYNFYKKEIPASSDYVGGFYLIEVDTVSAEAYADEGEEFAAMYPYGSLAIYAVKRDYSSFEDFIAFFDELDFYGLGGYVVTPEFDETPSELLIVDNCFVAPFYYGCEYWYQISGTFTSYEVAKAELENWISAIAASGDWEVDDSYADEGEYYLYYSFDGDYEDYYIQLVVTFLESGSFSLDLSA